tara:strand:+ start:45461 stop:45880 length:420 start_codon:yes stop_codon:yes gene_type:complete
LLHRVIYVSDTAEPTVSSTLSIAQILGVSENNNRRDELCSAMLFHDGRVLQAIEGDRNDIDRLMRRLASDPRHKRVRIVSDVPITERLLTRPMTLCTPSSEIVTQLLDTRPLTGVTEAEATALLGIPPSRRAHGAPPIR